MVKNNEYHVTQLRCKCKSCGYTNLVNVDLRLASITDITCQLIISVKCSECGEVNFFGSDIINGMENAIVFELKQKGYEFTNECGVETYVTRHFSAIIPEEVVESMKYHLPEGWVFHKDDERGIYFIYPYNTHTAVVADDYIELLTFVQITIPDLTKEGA